MLLWRRGYPSPRWKFTDMLRLTKMFFVFGLFVGNRFKNFQMMIRGLRDGFRGRAGPLRPI